VAVVKIVGGTAIRAIAPTAETAIQCGQSTCGCYVGGREFSRCSPTPILGRLCNCKNPAGDQGSGAPDGWDGQLDERVAAPAIGSDCATPSSIVALSGARSPELFGSRGISLYSAVRLMDNVNPSASAEIQANT